jgi:hypothetical protein
MGERYYLTGVQLGMLKAFQSLNDLKKLRELLEQIEETQFIGTIRYDEKISIVPEDSSGVKKHE